MTDDERAHVIVTARLLHAVAALPWLAAGLTVAAAFKSAYTAILLGLVAIYYGVRVALDARLFDDVAAERLTTAQLDTALGARVHRDWIDRSRGAKRLVIKAAIAAVAQLAALVLSSFLVRP
ncbi:MAG TPA: hypothetical protein VND45_05510 [Thermoanaerobaculia bacterium]|jgi:hypothetical protein|nr:hypothetical protein [Thermoanaerobaculia bacterium]